MVQTVRKAQTDKPFVINAKDDKILKAVYFYRGLTAEQIACLFFKFSSLTYVRDRLAHLTEHKYLHRYRYPTLSLGVSAWVYELGTLGIKYLRRLEDFDVADRFRGAEDEERGYGNVKHLLTLNDFLIAGEKLPQLLPSINLTYRLHDWMLHQEPLKAKIGREEVSIIPDGFLHCHVTHGVTTYSMPIWVEMDMGSEFGKKMREKLTGILTIVHNLAYKELFTVEDITVAFVTLDEKRRDLLRSYVKERLQAMKLTSLDQLFLFASLPYTTDEKTKAQWIDPRTAFLTPLWYPADDSSAPVSLLELGN